MVFTQEQKTFIIKSYYRNGTRLPNGGYSYSIPACVEELRNEYPQAAILHDYNNLFNSIKNIVSTFEETGSVGHRARSGRPTVRTEERINEVSQIMEQNPSKSIRKLSQQIDLSYGSCQKMLRNMHLYPYKIQVYHKILPTDFELRMNYCRWFNANLRDNDDVLDLTFYTDEAWFHLEGYVNSQNMRFWSTDNPHRFIEEPLHPQKIGVWVAISRRRIIGPIFFNQNVNANFYVHNILTPFTEQLHDDEIRQGYFQQDNATAHTARISINFLRQFYDNRLISDNLWPARSPDLTSPDFFLFSYLKNTVFQNPMENLNQLQDAITAACEQVTPQMLISVSNNMKKRVRLCLENNGQQFQHLM